MNSKKFWWLVVSCLWLLIPGLGRAQLEVLRLDYVVTREGAQVFGQRTAQVHTRVTYVAPDGSMRTESYEPNNPEPLRVEIQDTSRDLLVSLDMRHKVARRYHGMLQRAQEGTGFASWQVGTKKDLGTKTLQSFQCHGWHNDVPTGHKTEHWWCEDPVSGQKFLGSSYVQFPGGDSFEQEVLYKVTLNFTVEPGIFSTEIPPDFEVVDR